MPRQNLLVTTLLTTFAVLIAAAAANLKSAQASDPATPAMTVASKTAASSVLASGDFVKAEHPTNGTAQIIMKNGQKYLKFDSSFKSEDGPDLFVILHRQGTPKRYNKADYVSLGRLKKVNGQQMYLIPNRININNFKSAVIWCRKFNATFGFAPLG